MSSRKVAYVFWPIRILECVINIVCQTAKNIQTFHFVKPWLCTRPGSLSDTSNNSTVPVKKNIVVFYKSRFWHSKVYTYLVNILLKINPKRVMYDFQIFTRYLPSHFCRIFATTASFSMGLNEQVEYTSLPPTSRTSNPRLNILLCSLKIKCILFPCFYNIPIFHIQSIHYCR